MKLLSFPPITELKTFYIHWHDGQCFEIKAGSYYKSEMTYIFTKLNHEEMHKAYLKGELLKTPSVLEIDAEVVLMVVDQDHYKDTMLPPAKAKPKSTPKAKPSAKKS